MNRWMDNENVIYNRMWWIYIMELYLVLVNKKMKLGNVYWNEWVWRLVF